MKYDAVVIGAGPGGYVAAIRLGQLGKKTLVVEKRYIGGVCLNVGCIPTKALIHAAHLRRQAEYARERMGLRIQDNGLDIEQLRNWKDGIVKRLVKGVENLWRTNDVECIQGVARLKNSSTVEVTTPSGEVKSFSALNIILATGSRPMVLPGFEPDGERVWISDHAVSLPKIPRKLLVLGGGAIGLEFAYVYRNLGSEVEVYELMPQVLPGTDEEMARELTRSLKRQGIKIYTEARALGVEKTEEGVEVLVKMGDREERVEGEVLLVSVGRRPNHEGLNLEAVGLSADGKGFIPTDREMRTEAENIFAIGDLAQPPLLAHKASKEGIVAAEVIAGLSSSFDPRGIPNVVYTEPQLASVGLSEEEARREKIDFQVGRFPFIANGRALTYGESMGFAKILVEKSSDLVIGVHILGPEASTLIGEGVLAIEMGATAHDVGTSIHPHPTLSEVLMEAAENVHKRAIHILNR